MEFQRVWQVHQCFNWWNHKDCCLKRGSNCYNEDIVFLRPWWPKSYFINRLKWVAHEYILSCKYFLFKVSCAQNYSILLSVDALICEDAAMLSRKATGGMQAKMGLLSIIFASPIEIDNKTWLKTKYILLWTDKIL